MEVPVIETHCRSYFSQKMSVNLITEIYSSDSGHGGDYLRGFSKGFIEIDIYFKCILNTFFV